jgi:hypothetical protein
MRKKRIVANDLMQSGYSYYLTEPVGMGSSNRFTEAEDKLQ